MNAAPLNWGRIFEKDLIMRIQTHMSIPPSNNTQTVQVKVRKGCFAKGHGSGTTLWVTPFEAREFHRLHAIDIIGGNTMTQLEADVVNAEGAAVGKSLDAAVTGPLTDSASSTESGPVRQSSALAEGQASRPEDLGISSESSQPSDEANVESSPSTTPTSSAPAPTSSTSQMGNGGNGTARPQRSWGSRGKK